MGKWAVDVIDDFPGSALGSEWISSYGTAYSVGSNKVTWPSGSTYSGAVTNLHDLIASQVLMQLTLPTGGSLGVKLNNDYGGAAIAVVEWVAGSPNALNFSIYGANWGGSNTDAVLTWSTSPVWVRMREQSGTLFLETATDGQTWTNRLSAATTGAMATALVNSQVELFVGPTMSTSASVAKLNLAPAATNVTPNRVAGVASIFQPTKTSSGGVATSRLNGDVSIPLPVVYVAAGVAADLVAGTSAFYLPTINTQALTVALLQGTSSVYDPTLSSTVAVAPQRVDGLITFTSPALTITTLATDTPLFENPAPEDHGLAWRYNNTTGQAELFQAVSGAEGGLETVNVIDAATGAIVVDLAAGNLCRLNLAGPVTLSLTGATAGKGCSLTILSKQDGVGGRVITWPSVKWMPTGVAPTYSTAVDSWSITQLFTIDGAIWFAGQAGTGIA